MTCHLFRTEILNLPVIPVKNELPSVGSWHDLWLAPHALCRPAELVLKVLRQPHAGCGGLGPVPGWQVCAAVDHRGDGGFGPSFRVPVVTSEMEELESVALTRSRGSPSSSGSWLAALPLPSRPVASEVQPVWAVLENLA